MEIAARYDVDELHGGMRQEHAKVPISLVLSTPAGRETRDDRRGWRRDALVALQVREKPATSALCDELRAGEVDDDQNHKHGYPAVPKPCSRPFNERPHGGMD